MLIFALYCSDALLPTGAGLLVTTYTALCKKIIWGSLQELEMTLFQKID